MPSIVDDVLAAVEALPAGTVVSYSDVAELVGTSPRRVGTIMARAGQEVDWWRVTSVRGTLPAALMARARQHWDEEGLGGGVAMLRDHAPDPIEWENTWQLLRLRV
ncbi:MGMT family protein [Cutibacterium sp. WCA-380-WT-3A]|uniref:MGMT family protein n=1 Tax=Cutibacterium porci TaxID=2605781 RepID=A0A7K0J7C2_9ACTN|nr:MGMT family protein [Cutibacterium porci]MSS45876.1 MGMT family protein [Cutibacterium porci]